MRAHFADVSVAMVNLLMVIQSNQGKPDGLWVRQTGGRSMSAGAFMRCVWTRSVSCLTGLFPVGLDPVSTQSLLIDLRGEFGQLFVGFLFFGKGRFEQRTWSFSPRVLAKAITVP